MMELATLIEHYLSKVNVEKTKDEQMRKKMCPDKLMSSKLIVNLLTRQEFLEKNSEKSVEIYQDLCKEHEDNKKKIVKSFAQFYADLNFLSEDQKMEVVDNIILPYLQKFNK